MKKLSGILILQRIIPHYRKGFFDKFRRLYPDTNIFFGQPLKSESLKNSENLDKSFYFEKRNFYFDKDGRIFITGFYRDLFRLKPRIIISVFNTGNLNIYILFLLRYFLKFRIILWSFGFDPVNGFNPNKRISDKIRLYLSQKADAVIYYWEKGKNEVSAFSEKTDHYFVAPNTLDTEKLSVIKKEFDKKGKDEIKKELNVNQQFHFVYTGRLLEDKQIDILIRAYSILESERSDCRLSIIGRGPEESKLIKLSEELNLKNIVFPGEILDEEESGKWIYISDAFIMPGRLGLSVVHSFSYGTPVISQSKKGYFHGEGVGYIKNGVNGYLVEDGNINELAEKMKDIISNKELSSLLRQNAQSTVINECSVEAMLNGFQKAVNFVSVKNN